MSKVPVLYYSSYGHLETMANAVAEGARATGAGVAVKRVPETAPLEVAKAAHFKRDYAAPVATVAELEGYAAIIVGAPTRCGRMPSQMASFLDQAGGLWARSALNGKVGGAFTSTASQAVGVGARRCRPTRPLHRAPEPGSGDLARRPGPGSGAARRGAAANHAPPSRARRAGRIAGMDLSGDIFFGAATRPQRPGKVCRPPAAA